MKKRSKRPGETVFRPDFVWRVALIQVWLVRIALILSIPSIIYLAFDFFYPNNASVQRFEFILWIWIVIFLAAAFCERPMKKYVEYRYGKLGEPHPLINVAVKDYLDDRKLENMKKGAAHD